MKKFLIHIALFSTLPLLACVWIALREPDRGSMWTNSPEDCDGRGAFIYNRIFRNKLPIDVAFLGSSHTINGINDTLIERIISGDSLTPRNWNVVNLGYCRFGPEMNMVIARDLFAHKQPSVVFIEINETMSAASHPMYPYFATKTDLYTPASCLNQSVASNIYDGFLARLTDFRNGIFSLNDSITPNTPNYGYRGYPDAADTNTLIPPGSPVSSGMSRWKSVQTSYSRSWITRLVDLCRANGAQVRFVYIPSYHDQPIPSEGWDFYTELAPVLVMDRKYIEAKSFWRDPDHLNDQGAARFSAFLGVEILKISD